MEKEYEFYTVKDIQQILHIGKTKAYDLCKLQLFSTIKIGSKTLIYKDSFHQFLRENENNTVFM